MPSNQKGVVLMESAVYTAKPAQKKPKPFQKGWKKPLALLAALAAIAALAARLLLGGQRAGAVQVNYTQESVEKRTITSSLSGSGTLQPADSYTVTTLVEGEVLSAGFEEGDVVEKDTILYEIDSSDAANNIEKSQLSLNQARRSYENTMNNQYVKAPISGRLYSLAVEAGDEVKQGQVIGAVRQSDNMILTVPFPADDAQTFCVGQSAVVTLDNTFETLSGTVKSVSGSDIVGAGNTVTRNVTICVPNPGGLGAEQAATATIDGACCAAPGVFTYSAYGDVTASASGTVDSVLVEEGAAVSKNQTILTLGGDSLDEAVQSARDNLRNAELSMENTQEQLENYTVTAPIRGTIVDKNYKAGETVEGGSTLCVIYDLTYLEMTLNIDELDISSVAVGQEVTITADAVEGQVYTGVVTKVSVAGNTSGGITSYPVTVRIDETDGLRPGMNVDAQIVLDRAEDVPAIPNAALSRGNRVLITADSPSAANAAAQEAPEGYCYVSVETGVSDDDFIQIVSGLQEGDIVAYIPPQSSGGSFDMMMGAMPGGMGPGMPGGGGGAVPGGMPGGGGGGMPGGGGRP